MVVEAAQRIFVLMDVLFVTKMVGIMNVKNVILIKGMLFLEQLVVKVEMINFLIVLEVVIPVLTCSQVVIVVWLPMDKQDVLRALKLKVISFLGLFVVIPLQGRFLTKRMVDVWMQDLLVQQGVEPVTGLIV